MTLEVPNGSAGTIGGTLGGHRWLKCHRTRYSCTDCMGSEEAPEGHISEMLKNHWFLKGRGGKVAKNAILASRERGSGGIPGGGPQMYRVAVALSKRVRVDTEFCESVKSLGF